MPNKLPFLPDEYHYAIAHVAARAAQLDHQIEFSVNAQMRSYRRAAKYIIKGLDTNRLVGLLDALLRDNFPSRISEIDALMHDIRIGRQERNEVLHWLWSKGDDDATAKLGSLRIHRDPDIKTKTAEEVYALADCLLRAVLSLQHFDDLAHGTAWPDKHERLTPPQHSASPETQNPQEGGGLLGHPPPPSPERSGQ